MSNLCKAIQLAWEYHWMQKDKAGEPYMGHLLRVAARVADDPELMTVALLHDLFEDHPDVLLKDYDRLLVSFGRRTLDALGQLTRADGESYDDFIERIAFSGDVWAVRVKIADLKDNLDPDRMIHGEEGHRLRERYRKALERLDALEWAKPGPAQHTNCSGPLPRGEKEVL